MGECCKSFQQIILSGSKILLIFLRFHENYNEKSDEGYFFEFGVQYLEKLHELHSHLPFLSERKKIEKEEILVVNLHDKIEYVLCIRNLKQALNHK